MDRRVTEGQYTQDRDKQCRLRTWRKLELQTDLPEQRILPRVVRAVAVGLVKGNDLDACRGVRRPDVGNHRSDMAGNGKRLRVRCRTRSRERLHRKVGQELR